MNTQKFNAEMIRAMKGRERIAALTAYDFGMAHWLNYTGVPLLLVGDSLGMVVLGYPDTTRVTMADMEHHVRAVARAKPYALLVADLPANSYGDAPTAVANANRLRDAGAEAVKAEGGRNIIPQVSAIIAEGIPFLGHLGMLPQRVVQEGGYKIKGKTPEERSDLLADAEALTAAGAFGIVLELVTSVVAKEITEKIPIPTIGIGSGTVCDGEILVTTDLLGTSPGFIPKHVKKPSHFAELMREAVVQWRKSLVKTDKS